MKNAFKKSTIWVLSLFIITITSAGYAQTYISLQINNNPCTGIAESQVALAMHIFPNPNNGTLTLTIEARHEMEQLNIEVMNAFGQLVHHEIANNVKMKYEKQVDISNYAKGMYFVRIQENENYIINKIFID